MYPKLCHDIEEMFSLDHILDWTPDIKEFSISFDDLLHWILWPNFIEFYGEVKFLGFETFS